MSTATRAQTPAPEAETPLAPSSEGELAAVRDVASTLAVDHGLDLVDVEWTANRSGRVLRVIIDRPLPERDAEELPTGEIPLRQGATLDDCVRLSRDLSRVLDEDDVIPQSYSLEVSSPGLDRPLQTSRDFRRQVGRLAKVKLVEPAPDGQVVLRGTILSADERVVKMRVDGNVHEVELGMVREAKLVFELDTKPKPGKGAKRKASKPRKKKGKR